MTDWLSLAKDIMLPAGFGLVQQVSCGSTDRTCQSTHQLNIDGPEVVNVPASNGHCSKVASEYQASPAGKIHPLPEPSHVPFIDRIHWFLDMRYAELAGEEAPWGDYETSLARERGY